MIADLGLIDSLVGVSEECRWPPEVVGKPVVTAAGLDPAALSSLEIDEAVRESVRDGRSLYSVDADLIAALAPDLIVTQDLCAVCAVSSGELATACPVGAEVLSLDPRTLRGVSESVRLLAARLGVPRRGEEIVGGDVGDDRGGRGRRAGSASRGACSSPSGSTRRSARGHWLPEMIELAGGVDVLGRAGEPSYSDDLGRGRSPRSPSWW